jgi:signal transduction histidine kinase/ligand-binding sensor domain-containing protein
MRKLLFLILLLESTTLLNGQLLPVKQYSTGNGLNSNVVTDVLQDERGILWISTNNGLNWYDGTRFYHPELKGKAGQVNINRMRKDSKGTIWIATYYNGLFRYKNNSFENFLPDSSNLVSNSNNIFDIVQLTDEEYAVSTDKSIFLFNGKSFRSLDSPNSSLKFQISSIASTKENGILIAASEHNGLYYYKDPIKKTQPYSILIQNYVVKQIMVDGEKIYLSTNKGLLFFSDLNMLISGKPTKVFDAGKQTGDIIYKDNEGNIWFSNFYACKIVGENVVTYKEENGFPPTVVNTIKEDNEGYYRYYDLGNEHIGTFVDVAARDKEGNLWLGTFGGLIINKDKVWKNINKVNGKDLGFVLFIEKDDHDRVWVGCSAGLYEIVKGKLIPHSDKHFSAVFTEPKGSLWLATDSGDVINYSDKHFLAQSLSKRIPDRVTSIYKSQNDLWLGFWTEGLMHYTWENTQWNLKEEFNSKTGYNNFRIRCLAADGKGNLLVGTRTQGIYILPLNNVNRKHAEQISTTNGLSSNWVKNIFIDERGSIVAATSTAVDIIDPSNFEKPTIQTNYFSDRRSTLEPFGVGKDKNTYWIGTYNGVVEFNPQLRFFGQHKPKIYITQVTIDGKPDSSILPYTSSNKKIKLPYWQNNVSFDYAGISFEDEDAVRYQYMLEGLEKDWNSITNRRYTNYSNLSPGVYTFKVKAQNGNGQWSDAIASYQFQIATPFWKQAWFIALSALLILGLIYSWYRYRLQQALKLERLRTRISTDLHDDIGSTLSSISILSEMALKEEEQRQSQQMMQEIKDNSITLMEKMDDIVWSINPGNDSFENLMLRIQRFAAKLFEAKNIEYDIGIDENIRHIRLPMEHRQHIYLIMKESINNLVKYSGCSRAAIKALYKDQQLLIKISDNGKGFDTSIRANGNGLVSMRNRANAIKGRLELESESGLGTVVQLAVKIK